MAMTINCINEMNLYFHMQNHYKKLRTAKSKINNFSQSFQNLPSSRSEKLLRPYNCNERHEKICPLLHHKRKKQTGIQSKSEPCMIDGTKENTVDKIPNSDNPMKLQSMKKGGNNKQNKRVQKSEENDENAVPKIDIVLNGNHDDEKTNYSVSENESTNGYKSTVRTIEDINETEERLTEKEIHSAGYSRAEEHEFLQFLLRITEDIIINNYSKSEDIENVFEHHIEINKERLSMEKMLSQVEGLSSALNISSHKYKTSAENAEKHVFEPSTESYDCNQFRDCNECSVKRILPMPDKKSRLNGSLSVTKFNVNSVDNLNDEQLRNVQCNDGSTTCIELKDEQTKFPSVTEIPTSNVLDILNGKKEINENDSDLLFINEELEEDFTTGSSATPAESVRFDEDSEHNNNVHDKISHPILFKDTNTDVDSIKADNHHENIENSHENHENISQNSSSNSLKKLQREATFVKSDSILPKKVQPKELPVESSSSMKQSNNLEEKSTQVVIEYKDEECDTAADNLNDVADIESEYVLINGPLYILKEALSPERRIVLPERKHEDIDIAPVKEISPLLNNTLSLDNNLDLSDYSLLSQNDSSLQYNLNFSRLLNSDYDLTPQKEESSNKYHFLMVDAYTSISNANITSQKSKGDLLVRSESYFNKDSLSEEEIKNMENIQTVPNLLTTSKEYLLQSVDASTRSSLAGRVRSENLIDDESSEENSGIQIKSSGEIVSSQSDTLEKYRMKERNYGKAIIDSYELRRHKSLQ